MMTEYKGFRIVGDGTYGMYVVKAIGPGAIPNVLQGSYSRVKNAQHDIDMYKNEKEERDNRPAPIKKIKLTPREGKTNATEGSSGD